MPANRTRSASTRLGAVIHSAADLGRGWRLPITGHYRFTSPFGQRWGRLHAGIDLALPSGSGVHAMSAGHVRLARWMGGAGMQVQIRYWEGTVSYYDHLSQLRCSVGERVVQGMLIGYTGTSGDSTGPHLHLEIHPHGGRPVNPVRWLAAHRICVHR